MDKTAFHELTGKWLVRIITTMPELGSRFTPLQHELKISPSRLSDNLDKLIQLSIIKHLSPIERRHPLLPEYTFTAKGLEKRRILLELETFNSIVPFDIFEKWSMLVVLQVYNGFKFNSMKKNLGITPKVLNNRLLKLISLGLVKKEVIVTTSVQVTYEVEDKWQEIIRELNLYIQ